MAFEENEIIVKFYMCQSNVCAPPYCVRVRVCVCVHVCAHVGRNFSSKIFLKIILHPSYSNYSLLVTLSLAEQS